MADLFQLESTADVPSGGSTGQPLYGSDLNTGVLRRKYNFGDRVSELAIASDPFFRMVSKLAKKPTDDPEFKFTERRPSFHKRYAYPVAFSNDNVTWVETLDGTDIDTQLDCMAIDGCMWMGDHCMESNDNCMDLENEFDCMANQGCYWMGDHCMTGSNCTDPIALNYNPIADLLGDGDNSECQYSPFINFGCTYEGALNFDQDANVDDGSCEYIPGDLNNDSGLNILDIIQLVNMILDD